MPGEDGGLRRSGRSTERSRPMTGSKSPLLKQRRILYRRQLCVAIGAPDVVIGSRPQCFLPADWIDQSDFRRSPIHPARTRSRPAFNPASGAALRVDSLPAGSSAGISSGIASTGRRRRRLGAVQSKACGRFPAPGGREFGTPEPGIDGNAAGKGEHGAGICGISDHRAE